MYSLGRKRILVRLMLQPRLVLEERLFVIVKETDTIKGDWNKGNDALRTRLQGNKELKPITKM